MSLKSFDKFCESLILNEPKSRKEIFDERQKIIRNKITVECLLIYAVAVFANTFIMEEFYRWSESYFGAMLPIMSACLLYWLIRNEAKGTLFAVNGSFSNKFTGIYGIFMSVIFGISSMARLMDGEALFKDGMATIIFIGLLTFAIIFVYSLLMIIFTRKNDKLKEAAETEAERQDGGNHSEK